MHKALRPSTYLPDAFVRFLPMFSQPLEQAPQILPQVIGDSIVAVVDIDSVHQFAIDIKLVLSICTVSNTHRLTSTIPLEMIERKFRQIMLAIDTVHRLQRAIFTEFVATRIKPAHECLGFLSKTE